MSRVQYEELACPFCDTGKISCGYVAGSWSVKSTGKNSLGSGKHVSKSSDVWLIQSGCSKCGKSSDEVEKELKRKGVI